MSDDTLRVLLACDHIDYSGALHGGGRQLIELTRGLIDAGVDATVCVLRAASPLGLQLQSEGLPFLFFGDHRANPRSLARLIGLIRRRRIQVLHLTDYGASTFGRLAGWLTGTPAIVQVISHHSSFQRKGFPRHVELAYRALAPLTASALAISASVKEFATEHMGFASDEVEVLNYPLPQYSFFAPTPDQIAALRREYHIATGAPVVGAITRFFPSKGIRYLVDAFAEVAKQLPAARLVLVGQGPEEAMLRDRCRELDIEQRVIFAGFQREAQLFAAMFDVAVVPSLEEGFGLVALESLALGVPVVASRRGGLPDIVTDGVTGVLVEPMQPDAIRDAIMRILGDAALRRRMSAAARSDAQRFSLDRYVGRLLEIYRTLATRSGSHRSGSQPRGV